MPLEFQATQASSSATMGKNYRNYLKEARAEAGDDLLDNPHVIIPQNLQEITIFDGNEDGHRIIVFLSEFGSNLIEQYGAHISMDGTFKVIISILPVPILRSHPPPLFNYTIFLF